MSSSGIVLQGGSEGFDDLGRQLTAQHLLASEAQNQVS